MRSSVKQCGTVEASLPHVDGFFQQHQPTRHTEVKSKLAVNRPVSGLTSEIYGACDSHCGGSGSGISRSNCGQVKGCGQQHPEGPAGDQGLDVAADGSPGSRLVQQTLSQV